MLQRFIQNLGTFNYSPQPIQVNLPRGVNIHEVLITVAGTVTVTDPGGGVAGTVFTEGAQRLIRRLRMRHDGVDKSILDGRWAYQLYLRTGLDLPVAANLANGLAQVATPISATISLPFERPWNANPFDTIWSGRTPVTQELALYIECETGTTTATSAQGSAAIVPDGTMVISFPTAPTFTVEVIYSTNAVQPLYVPQYVVRDSDPFAIATAEVPFSLMGVPSFDAVCFRDLYGANSRPQAGINNFTFHTNGGTTRYYDNIPFARMQLLERRNFPAVTVDAATDGRTGVLFYQFAEKGRLSSIVEPKTLNDPKFVFNVAAPTVANGRVSMLFCELHKAPGVTA